MEEEKKEVKYSSYTDAQKRATKKYRENNKEKVNEQRKKYYQNRKAKDPNFLIYKRQKAKEYYLKKKDRKLNEKVLEEVKEETKEETKEEPKVEPKEEVKLKNEEPKPKRKYVRKNKTI